jgi:nicotinamide phosphoribosyltransferase
MGQTFVANMLSSVRITQEMVDEAEIEINEQGYTFNREGWEIIVKEMDGKLPLAMFAVEEGRVVSPQTPILGIINTDDRFGWLPAYVETPVQATVWKMSTVASICRACRITLKEFFVKTGANLAGLDYALHNFGDRGADSPDEAPVIAGMAHAALFNGSDCTRVNRYLKKLYDTTEAFTSSVEATEHSVMCANSDAANRDDFGAALMAVDRLEKVVDRTKKGIGVPILSVVIDTYDSRRFVREYMGTILKDRILASGGKVVFRPDSGDPKVEPGLVGNDVMATFGYTTNDAGYVVLNPQTGVIQGDGLRIDTIRGVLEGWVSAGFSMDSFVLGMGSGITHDGARDDFSFSMKATASFQDGKWVRLLKEPKTDIGKKSLSGLVKCIEVDGELQVVDVTDQPSQLFETGPGWRLWVANGEQQFSQTFDSVREFARS